MQTYHYTGNNPLKYTDPSGNSAEIKNNGNGSINITFGLPDINSPLPASKPPATFRSGADPIQTSDPDFGVACWYFATIASLQALGHKPVSEAQGDKLGNEIIKFINGDYTQGHDLAASAIFGGSFRFNDLGDIRSDKQRNPINLNGLKANTAGVVVFKQTDYWKNNNAGVHAISLIRNEDGTFSARDPYDGKEVQVREDPNNPGGIQIKRWNDADWRSIEIQRLYSIEPVD